MEPYGELGGTQKRVVLLVGLKDSVVEDARRGVDMPHLEVHGATNVEGVRALFARTKVAHVIMGAGLELDDRVEIIREIFGASNSTTVHMKDAASGPKGFLAFIRSILLALEPESNETVAHTY